MDEPRPGRYTVKQVATLTGVKEATLRVWERRYGVVTPQRSEGGYRLYSDADLTRLRRMAQLVADGVPASSAARTLDEVPPATATGNAPVDLDLVATAVSLDNARLEALLADAFVGGNIEEVLQAWLVPELIRLGEAWESGEVTVAQEHFASAGVARALGALFQATPHPRGEPVALVGLPPGGRHELGLLAFAVCLRRLRIDVVYLGADVPLEDWMTAASVLQPRAAVVGATFGTAFDPAQQVVDALAHIRPPVAAWVGGGHAGDVRGAQQLSHSVVAAAAELAASLRAGAA